MNRLGLGDGVQACYCQRLGRGADALQLALLNSAPPMPAAEPTIHLFAAWPREWDATFTLRARGGFVITASQKDGVAGPVEIVSEAGGTCRLHNPWGEAEVTLQRNGQPSEKLRGAQLEIATKAGERLVLAP
jgi:hypothetical protein